MNKKSTKYTIEINAKFKEKNRSAQEYKAIVYAWLKGQDEFRNTLKRLEQQQLIPAELALKIKKKFKLSTIQDRLAELKLIESEYSIQFPSTNKSHSQPIQQQFNTQKRDFLEVPLSYSGVPSKFPPKEALKEKISALNAQQQYDALVSTTQELLNHPDITQEEKKRYSIYYNELLEFVKLKKAASILPQSLQKLSRLPAHQKSTSSMFPENRSTAISEVRSQMKIELDRLRQVFKDTD
jgi:hypothetical protein